MKSFRMFIVTGESSVEFVFEAVDINQARKYRDKMSRNLEVKIQGLEEYYRPSF